MKGTDRVLLCVKSQHFLLRIRKNTKSLILDYNFETDRAVNNYRNSEYKRFSRTSALCNFTCCFYVDAILCLLH